MSESTLKKIGLYTCAVLLACVVMAPLIWLIVLSVSSSASVTSIPLKWIPDEYDFTRYRTLVLPEVETGVPSYLAALRNTIVVAVGSSIVAIFLAVFCAWALSRSRSGGSGILAGMVATYMLPQAAFLLPLYMFLSTLGLLNSTLGLGIVYLSFLVPFTVWLLKTGFDNVPHELDEAARVDGLGSFGTLIYVGIPLSRATVATTALFAILMAWDEFFYALLFTANEKSKTVTVAIAEITSGRVSDYGLVAAAGVLAALPPVIIGFLLQKNLVAGLTAGGVKG